MAFGNFAFADPNFFFQSGPYPGQSAFDNALKYYQGQLKTAPQQGQLAASGASSGPAKTYQAQRANPTGSGDAFAKGTFADLMGGMEGSRAAGRGATSKAQLDSVGGAEDVAGAYGQAIQGQLAGQLAEKRANEQNSLGVIGDITSGLEAAGGIASEIIAPGNPFGFSMAANGIGGLAGGLSGGSPMGSGGFGGGFSPGFFSSLGANTGVSGMSGTSSPSSFYSGGTSPFSIMGSGSTPFGASFMGAPY